MDVENNRTEKQSPTKRDNYLWDRSGEPDPETQRLEGLLTRFQHDRLAPVFPEIVPATRRRLFPVRMRLFPLAATMAVVSLAVAAAVLAFYRSKQTPTTAAGWDVSRVAGTARIQSNTVPGKGIVRFGVGQILETDNQSRVRLRSEDVGQIEVDPGTRLRLLKTGEGLRWIALDHGTIHTFIWAPPGQFVVDTPSAVTVDLGCAYTLHVDSSGAGVVRTSLGWVGFKLQGRESFIPAGAACATRPKLGPGSPYFEDASEKLVASLARFDFEDSTPEQRAADLAIVLREARKRDALTLWHLLSRVDPGQRLLVYNRLRLFAPPAAGVTQEGILHLDQSMLDLWWNALGFDDISIWRHWEHAWSASMGPVREK